MSDVKNDRTVMGQFRTKFLGKYQIIDPCLTEGQRDVPLSTALRHPNPNVLNRSERSESTQGHVGLYP